MKDKSLMIILVLIFTTSSGGLFLGTMNTLSLYGRTDYFESLRGRASALEGRSELTEARMSSNRAQLSSRIDKLSLRLINIEKELMDRTEDRFKAGTFREYLELNPEQNKPAGF